MNKKIWSSFFAILIFAQCSTALATTNRFSVIGHHPASGSGDIISTVGSGTAGRFGWGAAAQFDYSFRPLEMTMSGVRIQGIVDNLLIQHVEGSFSPSKFWQIDLDLPIVWYDEVRTAIPGGRLSNKMGVGDLYLRNRLTVLDRKKNWPGLAFIPFMTIPTGNENHFVGDPKPTGGVMAAIDVKFGKRFFAALNVGAEIRERIRFFDLDVSNRFLAGAGAGVKIYDGVVAKADITSATPFSNFYGQKVNSPVELDMGVDVALGKTGFKVNLAGGLPLVKGAGVPAARVLAGVSFNSLARGKTDLPVTKFYEPRELAALLFRCPPRIKDFDAKVHDPACPKLFELVEACSGEEIQNIYELAFADMGLLCPSDPSKFDPQINDTGCPKYYDLKEFVRLSSHCPPRADQYREGIDDPGCPKVYTLRNMYTDKEFRAITRAWKNTADLAAMRPSLYFGVDKHKVTKGSAGSLDMAVNAMKADQRITGVIISGYADKTGTRAYNKKLSIRRAKAVADYLISKGIDKELIKIIGYGSEKAREQGPNRKLDRRVDIEILSSSASSIRQ